MKQWKFINKYYEISNEGELKRGKKMLKPQLKSHGYLEYSMCIDGKRQYALAHRLVAEAFIPKTELQREVNHKDCNRLNNEATNLEWCTHSQNIQHSRILNRYPKQIKKRTTETLQKDREAKAYKMKPVIDEFGNVYETSKAAALAHGLSEQAVRLAIKNGYKSANKKWAYLNN